MDAPFVDLFDPESFVAGVPHDYFAWLRAHDPVHRQPDTGGGYWAVTRYDDVVAVERDPVTFSSGRQSALLMDLTPDELHFMSQQLIHMDAPQHTKLRSLVNRGFTPRMIRLLELHVRELAHEIVDHVAPKGECDFVAEIAAELPLQVIAELMGVPTEDRWRLLDWSNRTIGLEDPEYGSLVDAKVATVEMFIYAHELAEEKRAHPVDDIISALVTAEVDGERLTDIEFNMFFFLLVVAGNETTRNLVSGGMLTLFDHPDQLARLRADRSLLPVAIEELLRWVSPVIQFRRTATRDALIGETRVAEGDKVAIYYSSANRDEAAFEDAGRFDITRAPNNHVAFGLGPHFCLGASLARLEARAMFEEILARMPDIEPAGPIERLRSNLINGVKHLPVRFTPTTDHVEVSS